MFICWINPHFRQLMGLVFAGAFALLPAWPSRAGTIKVVNLPATSTDAATGISTTNTYLCCIDFGNNPTPPGNINGVPFIHPDLGNQIVNSTNGVDTNFGGSFVITTGGTSTCALARALTVAEIATKRNAASARQRTTDHR